VTVLLEYLSVYGYLQALADGKCISSAYWLNSVLTTGMMCAPSNALHFPTACTGRVENPNNYVREFVSVCFCLCHHCYA